MTPKLIRLSEVGRYAQIGMTVGIGGGPLLAAPMALVRELIRSGARDLHLVACSTGGVQFDMLIGAGCAASAEFAQIVFNEYGSAPNFRRYAEAGRLQCRDHT